MAVVRFRRSGVREIFREVTRVRVRATEAMFDKGLSCLDLKRELQLSLEIQRMGECEESDVFSVKCQRRGIVGLI